jgi:hypothetical protein
MLLLLPCSQGEIGFSGMHCQDQNFSPLLSLPDHVLELIAAQLIGGSKDAFKLTCKLSWFAANRLTENLDLYELCGWGDGSTYVPMAALAAQQLYPNISSLILPTGWRHHNINKLLLNAASNSCSNRHASSGSCRRWQHLTAVNMHFHALSPATAGSLARLAPSLTQLTLSLDLAYERTVRQAWRIAALCQLPQLRSLILSGPDLRSESLQVWVCYNNGAMEMLLQQDQRHCFKPFISASGIRCHLGAPLAMCQCAPCQCRLVCGVQLRAHCIPGPCAGYSCLYANCLYLYLPAGAVRPE